MKTTVPVRAFHLRFGSHDLVDDLKTLIEQVLVPKGINHLVLECNMDVVFASHPEVSGGTLTKQDAQALSKVCKQHGIRLIPLMQCLGHQGWGGGRNAFLKAYPEFDETPHVPEDAAWPDFFAPSWCPLHPDVNALVFDLMDELIDAFGADAFHVGMDEVYALADDRCPRCSGKDRGDLFAKAVNDMYGHLVQTCGVEMFMWGDRLNNSAQTGYDQWEGDTFGTSSAIDRIPRDIVVMDWHYDYRDTYPSIGIFIEKGFTVIPACWYKTEAAVHLFNESMQQAEQLNAAGKMPGMLVTSWNAWTRESFRKWIDMKGQALDPEPDQELGELDQLYRTLSVITEKLK